MHADRQPQRMNERHFVFCVCPLPVCVPSLCFMNEQGPIGPKIKLVQ